jgi:hypothetical protein
MRVDMDEDMETHQLRVLQLALVKEWYRLNAAIAGPSVFRISEMSRR